MQTYDKICLACGGVHTTHKPKAKRCKPCIDTGNRQRTRTCLECDQPFHIDHGNVHHCNSCLDEAIRTGVPMGVPMFREDAVETPAQRLARRKKSRATQYARIIAKLDERAKWFPKGYLRLKASTMNRPLNILWLDLIHQAGSPACLIADQSQPEDLKRSLMELYLHLRMKGYSDAALTQLDAEAALKKIDRSELQEMPEVTAEDDPYEFDPFEDTADNETMKAEVAIIADRHYRTGLKHQLGLVTT